MHRLRGNGMPRRSTRSPCSDSFKLSLLHIVVMKPHSPSRHVLSSHRRLSGTLYGCLAVMLCHAGMHCPGHSVLHGLWCTELKCEMCIDALMLHGSALTVACVTCAVECSALEDPRENTALRAQRHWLRRQRVLKKEPVTPDMDIIELNVGGKVMVTHRSTLLQVQQQQGASTDRGSMQIACHDAQCSVHLTSCMMLFAL